MSERTSYAPGTPCWVDLATPDLEAAEKFYGALFGWEVPELPNSAEMGGYRRAKKNGKDVAGVMPLMQEGQPPAWSTYVSVADAEATIGARSSEAGGTVIAEPMDVADYGTMAVFADPTAPSSGSGSPAPSPAPSWSTSPAPSAGTSSTPAMPRRAKEFYGAVFGWGFEDRESRSAAGTYTDLQVGDGDRSAACCDIERPASPTRSRRTGSSTSRSRTPTRRSRRSRRAAATSSGPIDIPVGRFAVVADPHGAVFAVMQPSEETLATAP